MKYFILLAVIFFLFGYNLEAQGYGNWQEIDSLKKERTGHAMVVLPNGNILVSGNDTFTEDNKSCEIFDVTIKKWRTTSPLNKSKAFHFMTLLENGLVYCIWWYIRKEL